MKILVLHPRHWANSQTAKSLGVEVRHVRIGGETPRRLDGRVAFDGIGEVATDKGKAELEDAFRSFVPDVFLFGIHFNFGRDDLARLKSISPRTKFVMHYTDQRNSVSKHVREFKRWLDLLLVTNQDQTDFGRYRQVGCDSIATFYDGVDPEEYRPKAVVPTFDCYFGGNNFYQLEMDLRAKKQTTAMLEKFQGAYFRHGFLGAVNDVFKLVVYGQYGWDKSIYNVKRMLFSPLEIDGMLDAKIILNTWNAKLNGLLTRRVFRSISSGRLFLTEYCPGMEQHFQNHKHLVWFTEPDEGLDLIRYYLRNETERVKIGRAGRKLILKHHTFDRRLEEFVSLMRERF